MQNINNNINFTARLNVSKITTNKERWEAIAKDFKNHTTHYPKTNMEINELGDSLHIYSYNNKTGAEIESTLNSKNTKELLNMTNLDIVKQLRKLLKYKNQYAKFQEKEDKIIFDTIKEYPKADQNNLAGSFSKQIKSYMDNEIHKDPFWKNVKDILFGKI